MKQIFLATFAAAALLLGMTGCSKDEQSPYINTAELEKNLVGVWWDEYKYADVTETGVPFTRVLLAVKADADHTGCIYLGLFDETDNLPLAVYGGPKDAGFRWQLLPNGDLQLSDPVSGETSVFTRSADSYANSMTDVSTANLTYDNNQVTMTNGSYSGTLVKADAGQETDIQKRLTMPTATLSTNLNGEGTVSISDNPQNTWGR